MNPRERIEKLRAEQVTDTVIAQLREQNKALLAERDILKKDLKAAETRAEVLAELRDSSPRTRYEIRPRSKTSESVACAIFSDWHVEETVHPGTVEGLNEYNLTIAAARIKAVAQNTLHLLNLSRHSTQVEHLIVHLGGDFITGYIHPDLVESNSMSPVKSIDWITDKLAATLTLFQEESKCRITVVCNVGNHGRTTDKKRIHTRVDNSYEWLLYRNLYRLFPDFDWRIAEGQTVMLDVFDAKWRFQHGDDIKFQGGIGGITIPINKAIAQWDKAKRADLDIFGHWHQYKQDVKWLCNGSLIGYSAPSMAIKADYERPQQTFFLWEKDHGRTLTTPIFVDSPPKNP